MLRARNPPKRSLYIKEVFLRMNNDYIHMIEYSNKMAGVPFERTGWEVSRFSLFKA
jgi:hypothetical protein